MCIEVRDRKWLMFDGSFLWSIHDMQVILEYVNLGHKT
jgi:hypothetical protein